EEGALADEVARRGGAGDRAAAIADRARVEGLLDAGLEVRALVEDPRVHAERPSRRGVEHEREGLDLARGERDVEPVGALADRHGVILVLALARPLDT